MDSGQSRFQVNTNPATDKRCSISIADRIRNFRRFSVEALPHIDLYRIDSEIERPSLDELRHGDHRVSIPAKDGSVPGSEKKEEEEEAQKFGWIQGVLILNVMNLWGPMLFLRTSWLVGQGGIIEAFVVVLFSSVITTITTLSTSAIATNGEVKGGGTYYMLSRSLGPEYGGAIGLIFAFANMVGVAMNIVGFCESLNNLLAYFDVQIVDGNINDTRIIGSVVVVLCTVICIVGMEWVNKLNTLLFITLLVSIANVFVGSFLPVSDEKKVMGITGWSAETALNNLLPDYREQNFATIFSVYFPSATGILAGANVSGELKDPQRAIPKGTLWAIFISTSTYLLFAAIAGGCIIRDATGNIDDIVYDNYTNCFNGTICSEGLHNSFMMLEVVSGEKWIIYAGNFAATISSALACLVGAPRVFQALCRDKIYPGIHIFAKGYGKSDEPIRSYGITFLVALGVILIGDLNAIAGIMSNFFMAAFCLINFACFHAAVANSPGFRPSFQYWNKWVSALGALLCLVVTFFMDWITAIVTIFICFLLYIYLSFKQPEVNWGSSAQAEAYRRALISLQKLNEVEEHVKNYRPQILVLTGNPSSRPNLIDLTNCITKSTGLMICGQVVKLPLDYKTRKEYVRDTYSWFKDRKIKSFYNILACEEMEIGAHNLLQLSGLGKMRPNIFLMGFKSDWMSCEPKEALSYYNIINNAFDLAMGVGLLRMPSGLDYSYLQNPDGNDLVRQPSEESHGSLDSGLDIASVESFPNGSELTLNKCLNKNDKNKKKLKNMENEDVPKHVWNAMNYFSLNHSGTVDVWWFFDDGGLIILIADILSKRKEWQTCELRIFSMAHNISKIEEEQKNMVEMMEKFRIEAQHVHIIPDIRHQSPRESTKQQYKNLVAKLNNNSDELIITQDELTESEQKVNRLLRKRELLLEHSRDASLVIISLPIPRTKKYSPAMYMSWLEILTKGLPPCLLIRGNQTSVLTFYS